MVFLKYEVDHVTTLLKPLLWHPIALGKHQISSHGACKALNNSEISLLSVGPQIYLSSSKFILTLKPLCFLHPLTEILYPKTVLMLVILCHSCFNQDCHILSEAFSDHPMKFMTPAPKLSLHRTLFHCFQGA